MIEETKKFKIVPIKTSPVYKEGDKKGILFANVFQTIACEFNINNRYYVTGLTETEAEDLEKKLTYPKGTLSRYNENYWGNFRNDVRVPNEGKIFNLTNPLDQLQYKMCMVNSKVAVGKSDINLPFAHFLLTSEVDEAVTTNKKTKIKDEAYKKKFDLTIEDKINFSKIYNNGRTKITHGHTEEMISEFISKIVDTDPEEFLSVLNDPLYKERLLLHDLISSGNIKVSGNRYYVVGENDPFAISGEQALNFILDPLNQPVVLSLRQKIEVNKQKAKV